MKKIVITSFCMPNELDDLERVLIDLNKANLNTLMVLITNFMFQYQLMII